MATRTAIRIIENGDSNVEHLIRPLMSILSMRGVSFIHHETENGLELIILLMKELLMGDIYEANDYAHYTTSFIQSLIALVNDDNHTSEIDIECNINIVERKSFNVKL